MQQELRALVGIQILILVALTLSFIAINIISLDYFIYEKLKFFFEVKILGGLRYLIARAPITATNNTVVDHYLERYRVPSGSLPTYSDIVESPSAPP